MRISDWSSDVCSSDLLVATLRPPRPQQAEIAQAQLQRLTERVREDPAVRASLRDALVWLLGSKQPLRLFTESGVLAQESFISGLWRRLGERVLPERSEEHTSELQSLMRISYAVFCLTKKQN